MKKKSQTFKIGTRGSLLAVTQSTLTKEFLEKKTPYHFQLVKISTQGDQIQDKPLWQLDGKDFFTKELDEALLKQEVDLVIHSYKDLGSVRPDGIELGAISKRSFANDILLIKKSLIPKIKNLDYLKIGTSSPRRIVNIESSLKDYLPSSKENLRIECKVLRGNVNTRIEKLLAGQYDGIILAMAGLERLASHLNSKSTLRKLLYQLDFMVLPQTVFPAAASQGALGVEIAKDHPRYSDLKKALSSFHDNQTQKEVAQERKLFQYYGGGCHLAVGIYAKENQGYMSTIEKGRWNNQNIYRHDLDIIDKTKFSSAFIGLEKNNNDESIVYDELIKKEPIKNEVNPENNLFITSKHTIHNIPKDAQSLWSAGTSTWRKLAKLGFWVRGSGDSSGHHVIESFSKSKSLSLMMSNTEWTILTRKNSKIAKWPVTACYQYQFNKTEPKYENLLAKTEAFYWMSFSQYLAFKKHFSKVDWDNKSHFAGLGKTMSQFKKAGIKINPTLNIKHFKTTYLK